MIDLVNVTKTYETGTHALNGIDMHIDDGEFVFLSVRPAPASPPSSSC